MTHFYAQIDSDRLCTGVSQLSDLVKAAHLVPLASYDETILGKQHDLATGQWVGLLPPSTQPPRIVSVLGFRRRFTPAEKAAIEWAAVDRPDQPEAMRMQAAALRATLADQAAAQFIHLDDTATVEGVQGLKALGIIAPGRALEILGAPIHPDEIP